MEVYHILGKHKALGQALALLLLQLLEGLMHLEKLLALGLEFLVSASMVT